MAWELQYAETTQRGWFYIGNVEECTFELTLPPEQLPGVEWLAKKIAEATKQAVVEEDGELLSLKLYLDEAGWWYSKWLIVVTAHASPLPWLPIILAAVRILPILIGIGVIAYLLVSTKDKSWFGPGIIIGGVGIAVLGVAYLFKGRKR